jgi:glycosyltransferase involved in cell wall biosynthesis
VRNCCSEISMNSRGAARNGMQILYLATHLPVPANSGYAIRILSLLRALAALGYSVDFLSFTTAPVQDLQPLSDWCRSVSTVPTRKKDLSRSAGYFARLAALTRGKPYAIERFSSSEMHERITHCLETTDYACVVADSVYALVNLPQTDVPLVLNCHNVEWVILQRYAVLERNPAKRVYATIEMRRMRDAERSACNRSVIAMTCSEHDRQALRALRPDMPVFIVPNCVDTNSISPSITSSDDGCAPTLLFQGVMDWYPNRDAVEFFVGSILPSIRQEMPQLKFVIAGRNPPEELREKYAAVPGVELTGTVPDMKAYLEHASVVVVPLRIGSGTRIKILEAAAAGKAVVSTSVGAEGLCFEDQVDIAIADKPETFAREVVRLLRDPQRRESIGRAARAKVVEHYSQAALTKAIQDLISTLPQGITATARNRGCTIESAVATSGR